MQTLADGADIVTFSGDKLLGGPQAGIIVGRAELVAKIKRNPLKRALRVDKMTMAALSAVLRSVCRSGTSRAVGCRRCALLEPSGGGDRRVGGAAKSGGCRAAWRSHGSVAVVACDSQIGSGALPTQRIPSAGFAISPAAKRNAVPGQRSMPLAAAFRALPIPVIGRIQDGRLMLDLRCLEDEAAFIAQLQQLTPEAGAATDDHRNGRACRSRQDAADQGVDRRRCRSSAGREKDGA